MTDKLRPYQREGIRVIHEVFDGRALVADEPGTGKTWTALEYAKRHCPPGNIVVVSPASVKFHWEREARIHVGMRSEVLAGRTPPARVPPTRAKIWVLNYEILGTSKTKNTWLRFLRRLKPVLVIIDEASRIKDMRTGACRGVRVLCEKVGKVLLLTGTPVENMPADIFPMVNLLRPDVPEFASWPVFARKFTKPVRRFWGWEFKGVKNLPLLHQLLTESCLLRRRKQDVLRDMPAVTKSVVPFKLGPKAAAEYAEAEADIIGWLEKTHGKRKADRARAAEQVVKLGYLKRLAATLRLPQSLRWADEHLESTGGKLVLFGVGRKLLEDAHEKWNGTSVLINGGTPIPARRGLVEKFTTDPKVVRFLGNIRAAGIGMDGLQHAACQMALLEMDFNPAVIAQAIARLDRMGQTEAVHVHVHVTVGTIEEWLCDLLQKKARTAGAVVDGEEGEDMNLMDELEKHLLERKKR